MQSDTSTSYHLARMLMLLPIYLFCTGVLSAQCPAGTVIYVDYSATGNNDGVSWGDAFVDLQDALALAVTCSGIEQIWVAQGTYKPTSGTDRFASFVMQNNLAIYGGFTGNETLLTERDWASNETILSGDLNGDDLVSAGGFGLEIVNNGENSYHVILNDGNGLDDTAILDGFTIEGGNADNTTISFAGGGMYNANSSPAVLNCRFQSNEAISGGGMYSGSVDPVADDQGSSPIITNCSFLTNKANNGGGIVISSAFSMPIITNCMFQDNFAEANGGAIYNESSSAVLNKSTFILNEAFSSGGGIYISGASPTLTACTFSENVAIYGGGVYNRTATPTFIGCTFMLNLADFGGGIGNFASQVGLPGFGSFPMINKSTFAGNEAVTGGAIYTEFSDANVTNCIFRNNLAEEGGAGISNLGSSPTVINCTFNQNSGGGGRDVLNDNSSPILTNCIFSRDIFNTNSSSPTVSYSIISGGYPGTGNLDLDPLFVDESNNNLRLQPCSPAIDAGTSVGAPAEDVDSDPRPVNDGIDIGAYEFQGVPTPVVAACQAQTVYLDASGSASLSVIDLDGGSSGCGALQFTVDDMTTLNFNCQQLGDTIIVLTVTDERGQSATANCTVSVADTISPVAICPSSPVVVALDNTGSGTLSPTALSGNSTDNCGIQTETNPLLTFTCQDTGLHTVILTAIDAAGNTSQANCTVSVDADNNCSADENCSDIPLTLNGNPITDGIYQSTSTITSAGSISSTGDVVFEAGQSITLTPGFSAMAGSSFIARIEACNPTSTAKYPDELQAEHAQATNSFDMMASNRLAEGQQAGNLAVQVFPNPLSDQATISLLLPKDEKLEIRLFNITGTFISRVVSSTEYPPGKHTFTIDGSILRPGLYILVLQIGRQVYERRVAVVK